MIDDFRGKYRWLSNYGTSVLRYNGATYKNSEAAYQAEKFEDPQVRWEFEQLPPEDAKKLAKLYQDQIREDWFKVNVQVMSDVVHAKFSQNEELKNMLVATFPHELVEGNTWNDCFWGICDGVGQNMLGRILMAERAYWIIFNDSAV